MKRLVALTMCAVSLGAAAQVTYPYNPDEDGNGQIAVGDLQGILATYGNAFSPSEILVDGETLTTVLTQLQNSIDSLSGLTGGGGSVLDMPLGTVLPIATESVPEGWMLCDGREISIEEYQGLYDLIGTTYGAGDSAFWAQVFYPATTFNIPDLRGRTIIGANNMGGEESNVIVAHLAQIGEKGGAERHSLTESELPEHTHEVQYFRRTYGSGAGHPWNGTAGDYSSAGDPQWVSNSVVRAAGGGGNQPHNNMQPYMALNYMMKVQAAEDVLTQLQATIEAQQMQIDSLIALSSQSYIESNTNGFTYSGSGNHNAYITWSSDSNSWSYTSDTFPVNQGQIVILGYSQNINFCSNCQSGGIAINHHCFNSNGEEIPITSMGDFLTVLPTPGSTELHFETMVNLEMTMGNGWSAYSNFGFSMIRLQ